MPNVLCFGEALWDLTREGMLPGGAPMNVALCLARLGVDTTLLSRVGDDELGHELIGYVSDQGLDTARIQLGAQRPTGRVNVDTGNRRACAVGSIVASRAGANPQITETMMRELLDRS